MKNYTEETREVNILNSVTCDKCKETYDDVFDLQEFHHISFVGGYASVFGDMLEIKADICQSCLKDFIIGFCRSKDTFY